MARDEMRGTLIVDRLRTEQTSAQRHGSVADVIELATWTGQRIDDIVGLTGLGTKENGAC